ncbi:MAG: T9SS type A sorting domain-containing protein [Bacteroidetes bacterium]|nr:T9SS type A sorting domain-containing protein [Bacteroidota bacterium]
MNGNTLTSNSAVGNYTWIDCISGITLSLNNSYTPIISGSYAVIIEYNGCIDTSLCHYVSIPNSINEISEESSTKIYPNPSNDKVFFENLKFTNIELYSIEGKKIQECKFVGKYILDVSKLSKGIYFVKDITNFKVYKLILIKRFAIR